MIVENAEFSLPKRVSSFDDDDFGSWRSDGKHYWLNGESFAHPVDRTKGWPRIDFNSLFCNHQTVDEEFDFQLHLVYQFDNDEMKTKTLKYKIKVMSKWKGPHPSIWWW